MAKANNADPFDVWGKPPERILMQLGRDDQNRLRRYVERVAKKVYRMAYDIGRDSAPPKIVRLPPYQTQHLTWRR